MTTAQTSAKKVDEFGNVSHDVTLRGINIGQVHKAGHSWIPVAPNGEHGSRKNSRLQAVEILEFWASLKGGAR